MNTTKLIWKDFDYFYIFTVLYIEKYLMLMTDFSGSNKIIEKIKNILKIFCSEK